MAYLYAVPRTNLKTSTKWRQDRAATAFVRAYHANGRHESAYVIDLQRIMKGTTDGILKVVETEHLNPPLHLDAPAGLGGKLLVKLTRWQRPKVMTAFDRMAGKTVVTSAATHQLIGINPKHVAGIASVIDHARERNVALIRDASEDFLTQVTDILDDMEGASVDDIRDALEERAGVSQSRARLIARDQTLKLNSQIAEHRQRAAGALQYRWSTAKDERVAGNPGGKYPKAKPSHWDREGKIFSWDDPPDEDEDDGPPGQNRPQCRCVPIPYIEELEGEEAGEQAAEGGEEEEGSMAAEE